MDKKLFSYNAETHTALYGGAVVPSITQLLELAYPLDRNISESVLKNASERGTFIHNQIELYNKGEEIAEKTEELKDYISFMKTYKLVAHKQEQEVYLLDENGELIAYGHFDLVAKATEDIKFGSEILFEKDHLYLIDFKTTSIFYKDKTAVQTALYRVAYKQTEHEEIDNQTFGLHLRDGLQLHKLEQFADGQTIEYAKIMRKEWDKRNG